MDEAGLIRDAQKGDLNSYNTLVLHYQSQAFNVAYRIMGDPDSAADATQDAFISAYRSIHSFRGGSFKSWLLRIVTNACYDELRRRKRRPNASLDALYVEDESSADSSLASHAENPESYAQRMDLQAAIQSCLQGLSEEQRAVAVLCEIAGITGSALGTVKSRLSRAMPRLWTASCGLSAKATKRRVRWAQQIWRCSIAQKPNTEARSVTKVPRTAPTRT